MNQNLTPLFRPRSVAIVGISQPERFGGQLAVNLRNFGYAGQLYGVNPRYEQLYGRPCYPSLAALPERPDCALLAVPNERLLTAVQETAACEIPAAVIFASAFGVQAEIATIARAHNMVICGPNCMGLISLAHRFPVSGYPVLAETPMGHITLISHSGSVWESLVQNSRGIGFNYAISAGNEMVTTLADYMHFALDDPTTKVIALFMETARDPDGFRRALQRAAVQDVPIVALKVGRSQRGARLAQAHSGALAGADAVYEALFAHYGVCRVRSLDEMMDTLELFAAGYRPPTNAISAMHDSGGERALLVDLAEAEGVHFAEWGDETRTAVAHILEPGLTIENPLDAWGTGNDTTTIYQSCALALDADPATGLTLISVDLMRGSTLPPTYPDMFLPIRQQFTKPLAFLANVTAAAGEDQLAQLRGAGIPVLLGTETGLRAVGHLLGYAEGRRSREAEEQGGGGAGEGAFAIDHLPFTVDHSLDEHGSKQLLASYGIPVTAEAIAETVEEAWLAAERLGYPVVLKTAVPHIHHKTEVNGIHLNLANGEQVTAAYTDLASRLGPRVLVQEMVRGGAELILGVANDAQFGPLLVVGMGGIWVELLDDKKLLLLPTTATAVRQALLSLRGAALLQGGRNQPPVDLTAVVDVALKLAQFTADYAHLIQEIDINPLVVRPDGVVAVDALIVLRDADKRR
jgi:acyl-CoA synthetase (NDP forming)